MSESTTTRQAHGGPPAACCRRTVLLAGWLLRLPFGLAGCDTPPEAGSAVSGSADPASGASLTGDSLRAELDAVLAANYRDRHLHLGQHAAWQILHGALAYQRDFLVQEDDQLVSAVDYLLAGGRMKGWTVELVPADEPGKIGLRALTEPGSKTGQGHADQWLAVLAQCSLPIDQPIKVGDQTVTMGDFVRQVQLDVPRNFDREYSWTLIGLTAYLPTNATWTASDGQSWGIERLVQIEAEQELASSACGGTHRLIGLTMALRQHIEAGGAVTGPWDQAQTVIQQAVAHARQFQNSDGSFSTRYFAAPGSTPDLAQNLGVTGHILEFLALTLDAEELNQPWVRRSATNLSRLFRLTQEIPLECGALYHAAHGLMLYRQRCFGPTTYAEPAGVSDSTAPAPAAPSPTAPSPTAAADNS